MIDLRRSYSLPFEDEPLTWKPVTSDGVQTATLVCSKGHAGLIAEHEVAADGTVTPSVVCTQDGCTFHEFVKLAGWDVRTGNKEDPRGTKL